MHVLVVVRKYGVGLRRERTKKEIKKNVYLMGYI